MRRLAFAALAFFLLPLSAHADDASRRAKVEELFTIMHMDRTLQTTMKAMENSVIPMTEQMFGTKVPDSLKSEVADMQKQLFDLIEDQMSWKSLEPTYVDIYVRNFSENQIDDLIAFYKSPTGQAMLEKTPELVQESMQASMTRMTTLQPQIKQLLDHFAAQHAEEIKRARAEQKSGS